MRGKGPKTVVASTTGETRNRLSLGRPSGQERPQARAAAREGHALIAQPLQAENTLCTPIGTSGAGSTAVGKRRDRTNAFRSLRAEN